MPGMTVGYDPGLTALSLLLAITVTGAGFVVMARSSGSFAVIASAGLFMGLGVVGMHYMGMAAMRMAADLRYDHLWVAFSVLIAIGAATAALWLAARQSGLPERIGAAILMGIAIAGMHYTGMRAAIFTAQRGVDLARGGSSDSRLEFAGDVDIELLQNLRGESSRVSLPELPQLLDGAIALYACIRIVGVDENVRVNEDDVAHESHRETEVCLRAAAEMQTVPRLASEPRRSACPRRSGDAAPLPGAHSH